MLTFEEIENTFIPNDEISIPIGILIFNKMVKEGVNCLHSNTYVEVPVFFSSYAANKEAVTIVDLRGNQKIYYNDGEFVTMKVFNKFNKKQELK